MTTFDQDHALETFRSLITFSTEALKALFLLNGGAVVAVLAYLGQVEGGASLALHAKWPLACFVGGLVAAAVASFGAYFTQLSLYNESVHSAPQRHGKILWVAAALAFASIAAFAVGAFLMLNALVAGES